MAEKTDKKLIFLIPAYNEDQNIKSLLEKTKSFARERGYSYEVVIINDGSTDGTMRILADYQKNMPITVLDQVVNKGVGAAFKRGFAYAAQTAADNDIIVSKEADNTSDLSILDQMVEKTAQGYDLVLASCYMKGGGVKGTNIYRKVLSQGANTLLKVCTSLKGVSTFSSFYRVYKAPLIKKAVRSYGEGLIREKGFACMVELLLKLHKEGARIIEVPMLLKGDMRQGKSKMKTSKTIGAYLRLIARNLFGRL